MLKRFFGLSQTKDRMLGQNTFFCCCLLFCTVLYSTLYYSFSRLLTRYNWFFWHNFPNIHSVLETKTHFLKLLTHFTCLHTRSNLLSVFCKTSSTQSSMCEHSVVKLITRQSESQDDMKRGTSDYVFWKMNPDSGRQRGMGGEKKMKGMMSRVICCWWNIKHYSWPCSWTDHEGKLPAGSSNLHIITLFFVL